MGKQLLNLTLLVVIEEIENILATYPTYPYQQTFSAAGLHQDLVAYVLSRVPNRYKVVEEAQHSLEGIGSDRYSTKQLLDIEHWIHLGICDLLPLDNRSNCYLPQTINVNSTTSPLISSRLN